MRPTSAVHFVLAAALLVGAIGCRRSLDARVARDDRPVSAADTTGRSTRAECTIAGTTSLGHGAELSAHRDGRPAFALFADGPVELETTEVPSLGGARVRVLAKAKFGLSLEGWTESSRLDLEAGRNIELAGKTAYVPRGARLTLVVGAGGSVVVSPITRDLPHLDVVADCDAVVIGAVTREHEPFDGTAAAGATATAKVLALAGTTLPIAASPDGDAVFTLHAASGLRVPIVETADGLHLHYEDGIVVDGWVRREDLVVPTSWGAHSIHCRGLSLATTEAVPAVAAAGVARRDTPIFVGATPTGAPRGSIAAGGSVIVLAVVSGFAEIAPRCGELAPAPKEHFFVEASALEIGPSVPFASLRAGCR